MADTPITDWKELAHREGDGLGVALLWSKSADRVEVVVSDHRSEESFELDVPGAEALNAFYHPFAYATRHLARELRDPVHL